LVNGVIWLASGIKKMSNRYLVILELQPGATKEEVKKAYRRLSKIYHPDISKDENAKEKFIEINEAYEFLTKVGPTPHYESINYDYNPEVDEYEERRRQARARARKKAEDAAKLQEELTRKIIHGFNYVVIFIFLFNLLLTMDVLLPRVQHQQKMEHKESIPSGSRRGGRSSITNGKLVFTDFSMIFKKGKIPNISIGESVIIFATPIFQKPMEVVIKEESYLQSYNIFKVFGIVIPFTLLICALYFYKAKTLESKLSYAVVLTFLIAFQLFVFVTV
jgi:hypothetical protein